MGCAESPGGKIKKEVKNPIWGRAVNQTQIGFLFYKYRYQYHTPFAVGALRVVIILGSGELIAA